ncbi:putative spermidine/putrescine transport system permease protein [Rhizobiales bacterium GAS191]|nr:putative spermidine/putrescine transport system permease protein [Rhizobiales bacterium GAS191]
MGAQPRWLKLAALPLALYLLVLFVVPVAGLLRLSFGGDAGMFGNYLRILEVPAYRTSLVTTFEISAMVTLISVVMSYPVAYLMASVRPRLAKVLTLCVLLPFWTSALVRTTAWIILLQRNGVLNSMLVGSGLIREPIAFVYNLPGVLIGMSHVLMPFVVLPLYGAFRGIDPSVVQAAETLGAGPLALCRRIFLPLTAPGVLAGATIVFMSALGYYVTPALMGGAAQTMIAQMIAFNVNTQLNWGLAAAMSVVVLVVTLILFALFQTIFGLDRLLGAGGGGGAAGAQRETGAQRRSPAGWAVAAAGLLVVLFLLAPIIVVFPMSLGSSPFLAFPPRDWSLRWYQEFFTRPQWLASVWNSLEVALIAVAGSTVLGTAASLGLSRLGGRLARPLEAFFVLPMIMPAIILGVGLYYTLAPFGLINSPWALALGHIVLAAPFVVLTVRAALGGFDRNLELAALGLGASWLTMFRRVMLPVIAPGIAAGAVFAFITSFDDVVLAIFLTNVRSRTLPKLMYEGVAHEINPTITAVAALIVLLTCGILMVNLLLQRKPA